MYTALHWTVAGILSASLAVFGQTGMGGCCGGSSPLAGNVIVELKGKVGAVQISPGTGMPFVDVRSGDQVSKVYLGSMRYLIAQGFNPKVGQEIVVKAYKMKADFVAAVVTLPAEKKTIRLRDEHGWPMWRGGMRNGPMR